MPDGIDLKRIINLDPETTVTNDDYTIVDSATGGAKKFAIGQALNDLKNDFNEFEEVANYYKIDDFTQHNTLGVYSSSATVNSINSKTVNVTTTASSQYTMFNHSSGWMLKTGHKYKIVMSVSPVAGVSVVFVLHQYGSIKNWNLFTVSVSSSNTSKGSIIFEPAENVNFGCYYYVNSGSTFNVNISVYDVTGMTDAEVESIDFDAQNATYTQIEATNIKAPTRNVVCWGDSLTAGYGTTVGVSDYPTILGTLCGRNVFNMGISGEDVPRIMARQGGYPAYVKPFTIPASGSVEIEFTGSINTGAGANTVGQYGGSSLYNPVDIKGVKGSITYSNGVFTFARLESGDAVSITSPTYITCSNDQNHRDDIQCIYVGTNGGWLITADDAETRISKLLDEIDMMIDHSTSREYIVIGITYYYSWVLYNGLTRNMVETAMQRHYGRHYINLREYLVNYGLQDAGLTPTADDETAMANGDVPPSLLYSDGIHGNTYYYNILAHLVNNKGKELKYW